MTDAELPGEQQAIVPPPPSDPVSPSPDDQGAPAAAALDGVSLMRDVRWEWVFYAALVAVALAMRLWGLGDRAMHHDESLHAYYSWNIVQGVGYTHNPLLHGPLQYHLNALVFFLIGDSDATARLIYALAGAALVPLPWLLRDWLGRTGAACASTLLAFSPALFYFSRFARNDILMAAITLALVVVIWRYMRNERPGCLYAAAALLALAFAAKETIYITLVCLGVFLAFLALPDVRGVLTGRLRLPRLSAPGSALLVLVTLSLPLAAAGVSLVQAPLGVTLSNADPAAGAIGMPLGGGRYVAAAVTVALTAVAVGLGLAWCWRRWLICAGVFAAIYVLLYTSVLSSPSGVWTGVWQSLGYWLAQQDVARGNQPWYYYIVIGANYEFLAAAGAIGGAVAYLLRGRLLASVRAVWGEPAADDPAGEGIAAPSLFVLFLIVWMTFNFLLFTLASERMPWLLVHLTLPAALLAGHAIGWLIDRAPWRRIAALHAWLAAPLLAIALLLAYRLLVRDAPASAGLAGFVETWGALAVCAAAAVAAAYAALRLGWRDALALTAVTLAAFMLVLGARAAWIAAYHNGDTPTEILVYTQTAPALVDIRDDIDRWAARGGQGAALSISVDDHSGFSWPWAWYLRDYDTITYANYTGAQPVPTGGVALVHAANHGSAHDALTKAGFTPARRFPHRWWFPESYRNLSPAVVWDGMRSREAWRSALRYWVFREFDTPLGSEDAHLYYGDDVRLN